MLMVGFYFLHFSCVDNGVLCLAIYGFGEFIFVGLDAKAPWVKYRISQMKYRSRNIYTTEERSCS